jgi:hypothetical protein
VQEGLTLSALGSLLSCTALHSPALHCTTLQCTVLNCTTLHVTTLHCIPLHYTVLHCTALYFKPYSPFTPDCNLVFSPPDLKAVYSLHCTQCTVQCSAVQCSAVQCRAPWAEWGTAGFPGRKEQGIAVWAHHCTALHCIALPCTALHCTALHCSL